MMNVFLRRIGDSDCHDENQGDGCYAHPQITCPSRFVLQLSQPWAQAGK